MAITQKRVSIVCTETEELGSTNSPRRVRVGAVICGSHFTQSLKFLGCWRSYPEPRDLLPWKWVGTRRGSGGSAIDNAHLWLWKHYKQRGKFLLPPPATIASQSIQSSKCHFPKSSYQQPCGLPGSVESPELWLLIAHANGEQCLAETLHA